MQPRRAERYFGTETAIAGKSVIRKRAKRLQGSYSIDDRCRNYAFLVSYPEAGSLQKNKGASTQQEVCLNNNSL